MEEKTNVMRILDKEKIKYTPHYYANSNAISGMEVANYLNEDPNRVFKTLVTVSKQMINYVFVVPVNCELDLKKAAKAAGEKSITMIKQKELFDLTGYIHGGCSPIGMKKRFKTIVDISAMAFDNIIFSAGKIGYQVELAPNDLKRITNCIFEDIVTL